MSGSASGGADPRSDPHRWSARSGRAMIATAHATATRAALEILDAGGNVFDAAVAASLALGVVEPAGSGLGGMALMVLRLASGEILTVEGPCRAPALATPEAVASGSRYRGHRAVAVPGAPAVLGLVHRRFGRLPREVVLAPAIRIAEEGVPLTALQHALIRQHRRPIRRGTIRHRFLGEDGEPVPVGQRMTSPALAETLRRIARHGFEDFYRGGIARALAGDIERHGGFIRAGDLERAAEPRIGTPIRARLGEDELATLGPPGGGLALAQMALTLQALDAADVDPETPGGALLVASVVRQARRERRRFRLEVGAESLDGAAALLDEPHAREAAGAVREWLGSGETSHVSAIDRDGNAVSLTQSIERSFGAACDHPELGILYNGFLRAFKVENRRHPHYLRPGRPARSNAAPTLVLRAGQVRAAVGSTGSERIASGILQVLLRLRRQDAFAAVQAPRFHATPQGRLLLEAERLSAPVREALARRFELVPLESWSFKVGGLQLVVREGNLLRGVADPRRDGAAGPDDAWGTGSPTGGA